MRRHLSVLRPWLSLALVCAGFSLHPAFAHTFWTRSYLPNIAQQAASNVILAVGMTFVIFTGGIDLSVGSLLALCGVALGLTVKGGPPRFLVGLAGVGPGVLAAWLSPRAKAAAGAVAWLAASLLLGFAARGGLHLEGAVALALAVGVGCGLLNGLVVTLGRVPPFVVTLGAMTALRGLTVWATDGNSVSDLPRRLGWLGQGAPLVGVALGVVLLGALLERRTRLGRTLIAVGGNEEAARLSGVDVTATKVLAYALSGLTAALAALVITAKFALADTGAGNSAELNAIAAVVIGGTSLSGGRGSVVGSLVGALTIAVLNAGLVLVGVKDTLQGVVIGAVIVAAVMVDQRRK